MGFGLGVCRLDLGFGLGVWVWIWSLGVGFVVNLVVVCGMHERNIITVTKGISFLIEI